MAYNTSTGSRDFDDMRYQQDRDTQIDWDQDSISFKTNDVTRVVIDNSAISASGDATFVGATVVGSTLNVSGNVGIGTDSADGKLHVMKGSAGSVTVVGQQANGIIVEDDDSTAITLLDPNGGVIYFGDADDTDIGRIGYRHGGDYANSLYFTTNNAQQMTIDSAGKVGIGTSIPTHELTVAGDVSGSGTLQAVGNAFLGGTLNVTGATTLAANTTFTNISGSGTIQSVDHVYVGNNLFISGNIDIAGGFALGSDAEGDMYYRNSAGALTRLAKGSDNHVLTMNVNVPNWEAAAAGGISFNGSTANGLVTYGNASTADVESDILFNAGNLTMDASISGSGNLQMVGNTFIGGDLKASGSLRAKQIHITQHGFNSTSTNYQYVPFYSENEQGSPNYRSSMLAPFKGRLLRVLWRCQQDINPSEVTVGVFTGSMGNSGPNTVVVEHVVMAPIAGTYQVTTFNFTGSQHFIAGDTITIGVQSDANPGTQNATGIWEFDMSEI